MTEHRWQLIEHIEELMDDGRDITGGLTAAEVKELAEAYVVSEGYVLDAEEEVVNRLAPEVNEIEEIDFNAEVIWETGL